MHSLVIDLGSSRLARLRAWSAAPVDVASIAVFRALFGALMAVGIVRFVANGWLHAQFIAPSFHFPYDPFRFVRPWPGIGMYVHAGVIAIAALGVAVGYRYRLSAFVLAAAFTYLELLDRTSYLNHYYLICLLAWLLALMPADAAFSLSAREHPDRPRAHVPRWLLLSLQLQVAVVYLFAGVAKLNADWLLHAQPLRIWLSARTDLPLLGPLLAEPLTAYVFSWLGALFDLSIVGLLCWRRTRAWGFAVLLGFHAMTAWLFPIGLFPWLMTACATLFFSPAWPRALLPSSWLRSAGRSSCPPCEARPLAQPRWLLPVLLVHALLQVAIPAHHHLLRRDSAWTYDGFDFAWNVMVAEKTGSVTFHLRDRENGSVRRIAPRRYLTPSQERAFAHDPRLILELARHIARDVRLREGRAVAVTADAYAALNGRPAERLVDPNIDLTDRLPAGWILPLAPGSAP